ncbi:MAG: hypothetical protein M3Q03_05505 [Chloroflexota bacterium]|nr:hypothetical protein [Chloroflexota bacterium]
MRAPRRSTLIPLLVGLLTGLTVVIVGGLAGALRPASMAVPTPVDRADPIRPGSSQHPLVGAWASVTDGGDPFLYTFFEDGNAQGATLFLSDGPAHGAWIATGERTATLTLVFLAPQPPVSAGPGAGVRVDPVGLGANLITIHAEVEVDPAGDRLTGTFIREATNADGLLLERAEGTLIGDRIEAEFAATPSG